MNELHRAGFLARVVRQTYCEKKLFCHLSKLEILFDEDTNPSAKFILIDAL